MKINYKSKNFNCPLFKFKFNLKKKFGQKNFTSIKSGLYFKILIRTKIYKMNWYFFLIFTLPTLSAESNILDLFKTKFTKIKLIDLIDLYFFHKMVKQNQAILEKLSKLENNFACKTNSDANVVTKCSSIDLTCLPGDCSRFRRCIANQVVILKCPDNLMFSLKTKSCQFSN